MPATTFSQRQELGSQIKERRKASDMTLRKVAVECEISPASLSDIEKGIIFPKEATFLRLIEILRFEDKAKICDLYANLKNTVPPDITDYLTDNPEAIAKVRQLMQETPKKEEQVSTPDKL